MLAPFMRNCEQSRHGLCPFGGRTDHQHRLSVVAQLIQQCVERSQITIVPSCGKHDEAGRISSKMVAKRPPHQVRAKRIAARRVCQRRTASCGSHLADRTARKGVPQAGAKMCRMAIADQQDLSAPGPVLQTGRRVKLLAAVMDKAGARLEHLVDRIIQSRRNLLPPPGKALGPACRQQHRKGRHDKRRRCRAARHQQRAKREAALAERLFDIAPCEHGQRKADPRCNQPQRDVHRASG